MTDDLLKQLAAARETFCLASPGSDEEFTSLLLGFDTAVGIVKAALPAQPAQVVAVCPDCNGLGHWPWPFESGGACDLCRGSGKAAPTPPDSARDAVAPWRMALENVARMAEQGILSMDGGQAASEIRSLAPDRYSPPDSAELDARTDGILEAAAHLMSIHQHHPHMHHDIAAANIMALTDLPFTAGLGSDRLEADITALRAKGVR
jgi:hypothetical protein